MKTPEIALVGFVNTEEIVAYRLAAERAQVDGYLLVPNDAFARRCRTAYLANDAFLANGLVDTLRQCPYDAVLLGPIPASLAVAPILDAADIRYIGATPEQMHYELDKSAIFEIFPPDAGILPRTVIISGVPDQAAADSIAAQLHGFPGGFVVKFVGDYNAKHKGSPTGRVRFDEGMIPEAIAFALTSLDHSRKVLLQEQCRGREFSANYAVDAKGHFYRLGENVCYKRRGVGDTGPLCDGTGSIAINGTLPFLTRDHIDWIEERVVFPFWRDVSEKTGRPLRALLNLDMMLCDDGRIVLFEINCREAGGHTMATILSGLRTPFRDVLCALQQDRLEELPPVEFWPGASLVISAYPPYFPYDIPDGGEYMRFRIPKRFPSGISMFTGWVTVERENDEYRDAVLMNSPTLLFECHGPDVRTARAQLVPAIRRVAQGKLDFRDDIGQEFAQAEAVDTDEEP